MHDKIFNGWEKKVFECKECTPEGREDDIYDTQTITARVDG